MVFLSLFVDHSLTSLRIYAAVMHFVATFFLMWTRIDSINSSFGNWGDSYNDSLYSYRESSYIGYISTGIIFLFFNFCLFLGSGFQDRSFSSVMTLFLDVCGTFFCLWIAVDGLEWTTYVYVWTFCTFLPFLYNSTKLIILTATKTQIPWNERSTNSVHRFFVTTFYSLREAVEAVREQLR